MFKLIRWLIILVVILGAAVAAAFFFVDSLIVTAVETGGSMALEVDTTCGAADLGIFDGTLELTGLRVDNPQGFSGEAFLALDRVETELSLNKLMSSDAIELPRLLLDGLTVSLEAKGGKRNYEAILESLEKLKSGETSEDGKRFIIREVVIRNTTIHLDLLGVPAGLGNLRIPIPELRLKDVGAEGGEGVLLAEVVGALIQGILASAVQMSGGLLPEDVTKDLGQRLTGLLKTGAQNWGTVEGGEGGASPLGGALKGVGDLLKRKK